MSKVGSGIHIHLTVNITITDIGLVADVHEQDTCAALAQEQEVLMFLSSHVQYFQYPVQEVPEC